MLTPWGSAYYPGGLLALTVGSDGTATGGIIGPASFMWLRAQRIPRYHIGQIIRPGDTPAVSSTDLHPWPVAGDHRKLRDEVEAAYRWWIDAGEPAIDAWRFTITASGQRIELP